MSDDRHDRQSRLAEIGSQGQARIEAHSARLSAGPSAAVALAYVVRAGIGAGAIVRRQEREFPHAAHFRFKGPAAVARGAHAALMELTVALGASQGPRP